jgi:hypothetical protein
MEREMHFQTRTSLPEVGRRRVFVVRSAFKSNTVDEQGLPTNCLIWRPKRKEIDRELIFFAVRFFLSEQRRAKKLRVEYLSVIEKSGFSRTEKIANE